MIFKLIEKITYWFYRKFSKGTPPSEDRMKHLFLNPFDLDKDGNIITKRIDVEDITVKKIDLHGDIGEIENSYNVGRIKDSE